VAEILREGPTLRILVDGGTPDPVPIVAKVKEALLEEEVVEVIVQLPGSDVSPDHPVVADVIQELESETQARGVPLRFSL
jgi:hypothetical protein